MRSDALMFVHSNLISRLKETEYTAQWGSMFAALLFSSVFHLPRYYLSGLRILRYNQAAKMTL